MKIIQQIYSIKLRIKLIKVKKTLLNVIENLPRIESTHCGVQRTGGI